MEPEFPKLPVAVGQWKLEEPPRLVDPAHIFDYMNGAGELYLAYHFDHLQVAEYRDREGNDILVELYDMDDSRDAFGLLSLDWGGEAVAINGPEETGGRESIVPWSRALYGMGLLRIWSDDLYVRIMAVGETPEARTAILQLGNIITSGRTDPSLPEMLGIIKPENDSGWRLDKDRTAYFYSHLVLNSLYYLSHENILNLNRDTEAVMAVFEKDRGEKIPERIHLLVIRYPDHGQAAAGLSSFARFYLPEMGTKIPVDVNREHRNIFQVEDGWLGYWLSNRCLALAFGCPDEETARQMLNQADFKSF